MTTITTTREITYFTRVLPQGTYAVDHMTPWGPAIAETNELGHKLVIPRKYIAK